MEMLSLVCLLPVSSQDSWTDAACLHEPETRALVQVLGFYASQGLRLPQQPPLLMVKSAELGNAASKEHHHSSARGTQGGTGAAPVFHTRWPWSPHSRIL